MLHGRDIIVCPSSNRETHRQRWRETTCARRGEDQGDEKGGGRGYSSGGNHHCTGTTGGSYRRRLLRMRAPVAMQDHAVWLPSGGPPLRVLLVSGAVCQRRAPDPAGQAAPDARETWVRKVTAERETATGVAKGGSEERASRGDGEERSRRRRTTLQDGGTLRRNQDYRVRRQQRRGVGTQMRQGYPRR